MLKTTNRNSQNVHLFRGTNKQLDKLKVAFFVERPAFSDPKGELCFDYPIRNKGAVRLAIPMQSEKKKTKFQNPS